MYHIGLSINKKTMIIETAKCIDYLSCELYDYLGQREVTKAHLKANRYNLLKIMQAKRPDVYGNLKYAVVD